ncbi:MAG: energy-coupling factor transporter ATPase [Clostridiales bacterium]|nr:energy-coupling factor transporter ATPase [Clostridiales bacterium]
MPIIELKNVSYTYDDADSPNKFALEKINLKVEEGEFVALLGANGSGKSTLAKLLNGLYTPYSGNVIVNGVDTLDEERIFEVRKCAGMVFQNPDNQMVATIVEDDVAFGPENLGVPREEIVERVNFALDAVGMGEFKKNSAHRLSGGQKQRVAIAGVLAMRPKIIIFDEATSMLDPKGRKEVLSVAKKLNKEGITIIHITHNMDEVAFAVRAVCLKEGRIVFDGAPRELFSRPQTLIECKLSPPPVSELARLLKAGGMNIDAGVLDEEEVTEAICRLL